MATARVELYKDGDRMSILTNAADEHDFWESFCELLGGLILEDIEATGNDWPHYGGDWEFQLRWWLPAACEIVCKIRGYKAVDVREERMLISGWMHPAANDKRHEIGPPTRTLVEDFHDGVAVETT